MISYVSRETVPKVWDEVRDFIQMGIDHSEHECELQDVYKKLMEDKMGLVVLHDDHPYAAAVFEFMNYPQITALRGVFIGGSRMREWIGDLMDFLDRWAQDNDMDRLEMLGRGGWIKVLEKYGYKPSYVFLTKDLNNG